MKNNSREGKYTFYFCLFFLILLSNVDGRVKHHSNTGHHSNTTHNGNASHHGGGGSHIAGGGVAPRGDSGVTPTREGQSGQQPGVPIIGMPNPNSSSIADSRNRIEEILITELNLEKAAQLISEIKNLEHNTEILRLDIISQIEQNYPSSNKSNILKTNLFNFFNSDTQKFDPTKERITAEGKVVLGGDPIAMAQKNTVNPFTGKQIELEDVSMLASLRRSLLDLYDIYVMFIFSNEYIKSDSSVFNSREKAIDLKNSWLKYARDHKMPIVYGVRSFKPNTLIHGVTESITSEKKVRRKKYRASAREYIDKNKYQVPQQAAQQFSGQTQV